MAQTRHPKIFIGKIAAYPEKTVREALARLTAMSHDGQERELRSFLSQLLPEATLASETRPARPDGEPDINDDQVKLQPAEASA
jgi:hypothetical protein